MHEKIKYLFKIVLIASIMVAVQADAASSRVKSKGSVPYSLGATKKVRRLAIEDAKKNAVRKYASNFDSARFSVFEQAFGTVGKNIDTYVLEYEVIESGKNKTTKTYDVIIEALINDNEIEKLVGKTSNSMARGSDQEAPYITFVMMGREIATEKSFKDKVTSVEQDENSGSAEEGISVEGGTISSDYHEKKTKVRTTGGSVERKSATVSYRCFPVADVDAAISEVFTKAGYEAVDPLDVELDVFMFQTEFSAGADLTATTRREAVKQCRDMEVAFLATGYMDIGLPEKDAATGMDQVFVKVTAKVSDLRKRLPRTVASIRGVQYAGIGPNPQVARQNALNMAAQKSARDLVDQLRAKGVLAN